MVVCVVDYITYIKLNRRDSLEFIRNLIIKCRDNKKFAVLLISGVITIVTLFALFLFLNSKYSRNEFNNDLVRFLAQTKGRFKYEIAFDVGGSDSHHEEEEVKEDTEVTFDFNTEREEQSLVFQNTWVGSDNVKEFDWNNCSYYVTIEGVTTSSEPLCSVIDVYFTSDNRTSRVLDVRIINGEFFLDLNTLKNGLKDTQIRDFSEMAKEIPDTSGWLKIGSDEFAYVSPFAEESEYEVASTKNYTDAKKILVSIFSRIQSSIDCLNRSGKYKSASSDKNRFYVDFEKYDYSKVVGKLKSKILNLDEEIAGVYEEVLGDYPNLENEADNRKEFVHNLLNFGNSTDMSISKAVVEAWSRCDEITGVKDIMLNSKWFSRGKRHSVRLTGRKYPLREVDSVETPAGKCYSLSQLDSISCDLQSLISRLIRRIDTTGLFGELTIASKLEPSGNVDKANESRDVVKSQKFRFNSIKKSVDNVTYSVKVNESDFEDGVLKLTVKLKASKDIDIDPNRFYLTSSDGTRTSSNMKIKLVENDSNFDLSKLPDKSIKVSAGESVSVPVYFVLDSLKGLDLSYMETDIGTIVEYHE